MFSWPIISILTWLKASAAMISEGVYPKSVVRAVIAESIVEYIVKIWLLLVAVYTYIALQPVTL